MTPITERTLLERIFWNIYDYSQKPWVFWPVISLASIVIAFHYLFTIGVNFSNSTPNSVYVFSNGVDPENIKKDDVVLLRYTGTEFYPYGTRFVKMIGGLPGDTVSHKGRDVYINDKYYGTAKKRAGKNQEGALLELGPAGVIPEGYYFTYTKSKDSFDSRYRYVGFEPIQNILGKSVFAFGQGYYEIDEGTKKAFLNSPEKSPSEKGVVIDE